MRVAGAQVEGDADDARTVAALRAGDERAFLALVEHHHRALVRVAMVHVGSVAVAEEVAQETWLGVLRGIGTFEGRSSLRGWIFSILVNRARTRGAAEARSAPFTSLDDPATPGEPAVDPSRFLDEGHPLWPGHWSSAPERWADERLETRQTLERVQRAIEALPPVQQRVIVLRDVEGLSSEEVCRVLELSEANQRVLLHRARSRVRAALEDYLQGTEARP